MNTQQPQKRISSNGDVLYVQSTFHTIQGEGPFCGVPAIFIRLGGCNLMCPGCDTDYTNNIVPTSIACIAMDVSSLIGSSKTRLVVITGGEPFRQNISQLVNMLHNSGLTVQIETNGSMPPQGKFDTMPTIICSPKTTKLSPKLIPHITAYKYVLDRNQFNPIDGLPTKSLDHTATPMIARPHKGFDGDVYLQPMDATEFYDVENKHWLEPKLKSRNAYNTKLVVKMAMQFGFIVQLQMHKILGME